VKAGLSFLPGRINFIVGRPLPLIFGRTTFASPPPAIFEPMVVERSGDLNVSRVANS
jgi:hypothetical protein